MLPTPVWTRRDHSPTTPSAVSLLALCAAVGLSSAATADGPQTPIATVAALDLHGQLAAQVFASEPLISNPTNIAVDARGRVWVCDVVNYRHNRGKRPEGDRILILEDVDGDGRADKSTVFYQGQDIDSALGICLLEDRVIVSASPHVWMFFDDDGDDRADRQEILFTNTGSPQHDHSAHAFVFGPDGKLYWNLGNENRGVFRPDGQPVRDRWNRAVLSQGHPFRQGMAFRCNLDGSGFEVLAHNLRNSYELSVDPFGSVWFSDNDDDGNRGTRICYTLEGGNYGYTDELTGRHWRDNPRTGIEPDIPNRHWHQNDPGSIPNVLLTGSGSPSGIEIYEGHLLGEELHGALLHCEPGHNQVRAFVPATPSAEALQAADQTPADAAGYELRTIVLVDGARDPWFRPVDVAAAPDGSLMVADWYDPGVGGHHQADVDRGRIYRIAPPGASYAVPPVDTQAPTQSPTQWVALLNSPNHDLRRVAWQRLASLGEVAREPLEEALDAADPRLRARAVWLLARLPGAETEAMLDRVASDPEPRVRIVGLRAARAQSEAAFAARLAAAARDPAAEVRREVAVELRRVAEVSRVAEIWTALALQLAPYDRWSLEALGLAADGRWDAVLGRWLPIAADHPARLDLIWRARGTKALELQVAALVDPQLSQPDRDRLLRALDFSHAPEKDALLIKVVEAGFAQPAPEGIQLAVEALRRIAATATPSPAVAQLLDEAVARLEIGAQGEAYVELVTRFRLQPQYSRLLDAALEREISPPLARRFVDFLFRAEQASLLTAALHRGDDRRTRLIELVATVAHPEASALLLPLASDAGQDVAIRRDVMRAIAAHRGGAERLLQLAEQGELDEAGQAAVAHALRMTPFEDLARRAASFAPPLPAAEEQTLPVSHWMQIAGDPSRGKTLFFAKATCSTCHRTGEEGPHPGPEVGPGLSEIGSKLSRTGLYEAVLYPSAAISHNYEMYLAVTDAGTFVSGLLISDTEHDITLRTDKGIDIRLSRPSLESLEKQTQSLMPAGMHQLLSPQELADVIAYLSTLRTQD